MEGINFSAAAEIIMNPHDLTFAISGNDFVIARGPDKDNKQKVILTSYDLKCRKVSDPVECIRRCLVSSVEKIKNKLRTREYSFSELEKYADLPFGDMIILRDQDIKTITAKLKQDSPNGLFETFEIYIQK